MKCRGHFKKVCFGLIFSFINLSAFHAQAETVYYALDNVTLTNNTPMTGIFSWTYTNDFEKGVGQFISLEIPWTTHDETDLAANIDVTESIEITFTNNVHDDGVDIMLVLDQKLTPTTSSLPVLGAGESKYEIGGNGFHKGLVASGSIVPTNLTLSITADASGFVFIEWAPNIPGVVLQEKPDLSTNWVDSTSGSTNSVAVPVTAPAMFYRAVKP